jgi:hypothetical protein
VGLIDDVSAALFQAEPDWSYVVCECGSDAETRAEQAPICALGGSQSPELIFSRASLPNFKRADSPKEP